MNKKNNFNPIILALILSAGIYIGYILKPTNKNSNKFDLILNQIADSYVDSINKEQLIEKCIENLLEELDPHSSYIKAKDLSNVNEPMEGSFDGIGIEFTIKNDTLLVVAPISGGPSEQLGIKSGDKIIFVDDENIVGPKLNNEKVFKLLRGKRGSKVNIQILRNKKDELLKYTITRDKIPINSIDVSYMVDNALGYVKINRFSATTYKEFQIASKKLLSQGMTKMVLDLRNNPGGYLGAAINLANEFLEDDILIVYTEGLNRNKEEYFSNSRGNLISTEIIVLINEGSASASEIVAGAIQDNDRGIVAGRRSFGKGLVQEQFENADGSAFRLTTQSYFTPTGRSIQKPYKNGFKTEYDEDYFDRLNNGELFSKDSIKFVDSLKFITKKGKILYGGGGIIPDVFIPIDTSTYNEQLSNLNRKDLIRSFAFDYTKRNREKIEKQSLNYFIKYFQIDNNTMNLFVEKCKKEGVNLIVNDLNINDLEILETQLKAFIARNIWNDDGFYPIINQIDNTFKEAIVL